MFGPEYIPATYLEERLAAEKLKQEEDEKRQRQEQASKQPHAPGQPTPSSLNQVFSQRPCVSRPGSSTVLGGIYHSLVKTRAGRESATSTPSSSCRGSRDQTPTPCSEREMSAEQKREWEEKWREIDMVCYTPHLGRRILTRADCALLQMNMPKWH